MVNRKYKNQIANQLADKEIISIIVANKIWAESSKKASHETNFFCYPNSEFLIISSPPRFFRFSIGVFKRKSLCEVTTNHTENESHSTA